MSERYWGFIFAAGLSAGGALVLFYMVWVVGLNYCPGEPCNYSKSPGDNKQQSEYWVPFAQGPSAASGNDAADAKGHPNYYDHQDLRAQESVARATNAIVMLTLIGVVVGCIGTGLIYVTFRETRKTSEAAVRSTDAALQANKLMATSDRPWMKIETTLGKTESWADGMRQYVTCVPRNIGKRPALNVKSHWEFVEVPSGTAVDSNPSQYQQIVKETTESPTLAGTVFPGDIGFSFTHYFPVHGEKKVMVVRVVFACRYSLGDGLEDGLTVEDVRLVVKTRNGQTLSKVRDAEQIETTILTRAGVAI